MFNVSINEPDEQNFRSEDEGKGLNERRFRVEHAQHLNIELIKRFASGKVVVSVIVAVLISETTSNTASANMIVPVVIAIAQAQNADPLIPAFGATLGASLGFMLPASTPCNAIVSGLGYVLLMKMVRYGVLLNIVGAIVIIVLVTLLAPFLRVAI